MNPTRVESIGSGPNQIGEAKAISIAHNVTAVGNAFRFVLSPGRGDIRVTKISSATRIWVGPFFCLTYGFTASSTFALVRPRAVMLTCQSVAAVNPSGILTTIWTTGLAPGAIVTSSTGS